MLDRYSVSLPSGRANPAHQPVERYRAAQAAQPTGTNVMRNRGSAGLRCAEETRGLDVAPGSGLPRLARLSGSTYRSPTRVPKNKVSAVVPMR